MFTCGADIYLRCYRLHGGCGFEFTSGGSCGRACNLPPKNWDIYLRCYRQLPPVGQRCLCLTAWGVYLRWFRLHSAGVDLSIPPVAPADVPAIPAQELGHLPAVLQTFTCGAETRLPSGGCIPPVAVAQCLARRLPFRKLPAVLSPPRRVYI